MVVPCVAVLRWPCQVALGEVCDGLLVFFQKAGRTALTSSSSIAAGILPQAPFVKSLDILTNVSCCSRVFHAASCLVCHPFACCSCSSNDMIVRRSFVRFFCCFASSSCNLCRVNSLSICNNPVLLTLLIKYSFQILLRILSDKALLEKVSE